MARRKPRLSVVVTPGVSKELNKIWRYNAEHRSEGQADEWDRFLKGKIRSLATSYERGKRVEEFPGLLYLFAQKRAGTDGHIVVFQTDQLTKTVTVLHVFHSKQDWRNEL